MSETGYQFAAFPACAKSPLTGRKTAFYRPQSDSVLPQILLRRQIQDNSVKRGDQTRFEGCGQPPIHPKIMAGAILHGLTHGIRSSRRLEWACGNAIDFTWLVEGRTIDHSTFCDFHTKFKRELRDLFRQIGRVAMHMGPIGLNQVAPDGTRIKANSSRHTTASAKTLEQRLQALDAQIEKMLAEADQVDQQDKDLFGDSASVDRPQARPKSDTSVDSSDRRDRAFSLLLRYGHQYSRNFQALSAVGRKQT